MVEGWRPRDFKIPLKCFVSYILSMKTVPCLGKILGAILKSGTLAAVTATFLTSPWHMSTAVCLLWPNQMTANIEKTKKQREHMQSLMNYPWKIYFLQDGQAIKVDGDKVEHIGPGIKEFI